MPYCISKQALTEQGSGGLQLYVQMRILLCPALPHQWRAPELATALWLLITKSRNNAGPRSLSPRGGKWPQPTYWLAAPHYSSRTRRPALFCTPVRATTIAILGGLLKPVAVAGTGPGPSSENLRTASEGACPQLCLPPWHRHGLQHTLPLSTPPI